MLANIVTKTSPNPAILQSGGGKNGKKTKTEKIASLFGCAYSDNINRFLGNTLLWVFSFVMQRKHRNGNL